MPNDNEPIASIPDLDMADYLELSSPEEVAEMDGHPVEPPQIPEEVKDYVEKAFSPMEDGGVPVVPAEEKPFPTPMEAATAAALQAAHAAVQPFGLHVMVLVYSTDGAYRNAYSSELNGTAAVGFLQRAAFSVHSALK